MKKILYLVIIALLMPLMASAQSSNDVIDLDLDILTDSISASDLAKLGNLSAEDKAYRSKFLKDLKTTGLKKPLNVDILRKRRSRLKLH